MAAALTQYVTVKLGGSALAPALMSDLLDMRVSLSVHSSGSAQLRFADEYFAVLDGGKFAIGAELEISISNAKNTSSVVFSGEVVAVGVDQSMGGRHELLVEALDRTHRLSGETTIKAYLKQSRDAVVKAIASRHGLTAKADSTGGPEPYLLQTGTDYSFLWEMARVVGFEWFADGKTLYFRKRPATAGAKLKWGEDLLRFTARYSGVEVVSKLTVQGWDPAQQKAFSGDAGSVVSSPSPAQLGSGAKFVKEQHGKAKGKFGKPLILSSTGVRDAKEAEAYAASVAADLVGAGLTVRGEAWGNPAIKPGTMIEVERMGKSLSGSYYVTDVEHVFGAGRPLVTRFAVSGHRSSSLPDMIRNGGNGSQDWSKAGAVLGVVTNVNDPESVGRVKVRFPTLGKEAESDWARVVTPGAGPERGFDLRPEVDDEVLVMFDRGDSRTPFVLGGVWSAKIKGPDAKVVDGGVVTKRLWTSRVGHSITISDGKKGASVGDKTRFVEIKLGDKKTYAMISEAGVTIEAAKGKPLKLVAGDASITLNDKGEIEIKAKAVKIDSQGDLAAKAKAVTVKGATGVKIDGGTALEAKGAQVKIEGSAMTTVKGGMVKIN
jgi:phage protein D